MKKRLTSILLILTLVVTTVFGGTTTAASAATQSRINDVYKKCGNYIYNTVKEPAYGATGGEWAMYGLAQAGYPMSKDYIAKYKDQEWCENHYGYVPGDNQKHAGEWTATGKQFAVPYLYKTLLST